MKTIKEILAIDDISKKIAILKSGRRTPLPDARALLSDWNPAFHEIQTDEVKYPKLQITVEDEHTLWDGEKSVKVPRKTKSVDPNRISLPIEQDIVNIHTAFTVGTEPRLVADPSEAEKPLFTALTETLKQNKTKYQNRKIVRAWLSEEEVAECWYIVPDDCFWSKLRSREPSMYGGRAPEYRLKSVIWSPFLGDRLYPFFDETGDLVAFSREFVRKSPDGKNETVFTTYTDKFVYTWVFSSEWTDAGIKEHGFSEIPIIYAPRGETLCKKVRPLRIRLEKLMSGYADCVDYHFFPILKLFGEVEKFSGEFRNRVVQLTGEGADAMYLTWNQSADPVRVEAEKLLELIYSMTNTPRISFENLKGSGQAFSGVAFRYAFMGAHIAVENHAEEMGLFMQRRINFLLSALGSVNTYLSDASKTLTVETEIVPYMIDDLAGKVSTAVEAVNGGIWSKREGILFAGNADRLEEELKDIKDASNAA